MKFPSKFILVSLTALFLCTGYIPVGAQSLRLKDNISFSVNNVSVSDALEALTRVTGLTFSYNPDQIPSSRTVKVDMINRPVIEVLNSIIGSKNFGYRQMGNQIVIFLAKQETAPAESDITHQPQPALQGQNNKPNENIPAAAKPDTVYLTRNIRDTIRITETILRTDTVYEKVPTPVSGNEIFSKAADLTKELTPIWKFDAGITLSFFMPSASYEAPGNYTEKIEEYEKSYSNNSFAGSAGLDLRVSYGKWTAASGFAVTLFSQKLDYNYLKETGGFYQKDTLDKYYTLSGIDTTWYYILDSAYIPKDNEQFNYRMSNHIRYFEIPLAIHYNYGFRGILFYGKAGIIPAFYLGSDGQQIIPDNDGIIPSDEIDPKNIVLSYIFGVGAAIPIGRKFILNSSIFYRNHFGSIHKDFPIETRYSATGIQAGIIYKLY